MLVTCGTGEQDDLSVSLKGGRSVGQLLYYLPTVDCCIYPIPREPSCCVPTNKQWYRNSSSYHRT